MTLFRLTLTGSAASTWISNQSKQSKQSKVALPAPTTRRMYRWGTLWGILGGPNNPTGWMVERRTQHQSDLHLLESVERYSDISAPPSQVDDVWDEEVIAIGDVEYTGFVSVCLPASVLHQWCIRQGLPSFPVLETATPTSVAKAVTTPVYTQKSSPHTKQYGNHDRKQFTQQSSSRGRHPSTPRKSIYYIEDDA